MTTIIKKFVWAAGLILAASLFMPETGTAQEEQSLRYGPIQQTDTLWRIASRNRPDESVSVHQVMAAILDTNPEAFRNNSIHYMLTGFYLDIPDLETIQTYDPEQARTSIIEQLEQPAAVEQAASDAVAELPAGPSEAVAAESEQVESEPAVTAQAQTPANLESRLEDLREQVEVSMDRTESLAADNDEIHQRLTNVTEVLDAIRDSVQSNAEIEQEISQIQRQQQALQREQERVTNQTKWSTPPWVAIPLAVLALIFLILIIWIVRRCRPEKTIEPSPYQAATATHMAGAVEASDEADTESVDGESTEETRPAATDQDEESQEHASDGDDEEFFRDIDEILAEADAASDDEGDDSEAIDTEQSEKEQLAAELDLARAYLEMDEKEEAKDIINKVLEKADDELRTEAETLLKRIDES